MDKKKKLLRINSTRTLSSISKIKVKLWNYKKVCDIYANSTFGEVALMDNTSKRTASIISIEPCIFGVINKNDYQEFIKDAETRMRKNNIEILWTYRNIRSHKKLIPVIKKYPSCPILVIDDDIIRNEDWLKMFINDRRKYPEDILTMRCDDYITENFECIHNRINFEEGVKFEDLIYHNRPSNGCGGTLYPPYTFRDKTFFDEDLFMKLSPSSDEMWQFCFNIMNNQRIRRTSNIFNVESIKGSQKISLYKENKGKYTSIMNTLLNYFPLFKENLIKRLQSENELNNSSEIILKHRQRRMI